MLTKIKGFINSCRAVVRGWKPKLPPMSDFLDDKSPTNPDPVLKSSNIETFRYFWRFARKYQYAVIIAIAAVFLGSSIDAYLIYQIRHIVDNGGGILAREPLLLFAKVLVILMTVRAGLQFLSSYLFSWSQSKLSVSLSEKVFKHITMMPQAFFDTHGHGKIISKIQYEVGAVSGIMGSNLLILCRESSTVVSFLFVMFKTNWALSSVILLLIPVISLTMKAVSKSIAFISKYYLSSNEVQLRMLNEMVKGHQVVSHFNAQDFEHKRYFDTIDTIRKSSNNSVAITSFGHSLIQFFASLSLASIIYLAAYANDINIPPITPGDFIVIFTSMFGLLKPVRSLTSIYTGLVSCLVAAKSLLALLALNTEEDKGTLDASTVNFKANVQYEDVSFKYHGSETNVLEGFNLTMEAGKTYALVGKSGGGKSTIAALLARSYDVTAGRITIDGVDIRDIKLHALRDHISVVNQNVHLFDDTIYNNIIYCDHDKYTRADVERAALLAHVTDFAQHLPKGLDTFIGSDGMRLSGGQRQRVAIARAILRQRPIIILDEATSALDNESEHFIQNSLQELQQGRTVLVIAHRLSTIEKADKILVIKGGRIVESGTHQELIANTQGEYYKLYTREFED